MNRSRSSLELFTDLLKTELQKPTNSDKYPGKEETRKQLTHLAITTDSTTLLYNFFNLMARELMIQISLGQNDMKSVMIASANVHDSRLFGQINYQHPNKITCHLPPHTTLNSIIQLLAQYYHGENSIRGVNDFDERYKHIRESVMPYLSIIKIYGHEWVNKARFHNLSALRRLIVSQITNRWNTLSSANIRASLSLTMRKFKYERRIGLYRFKDDLQEGTFVYLHALYNRLPNHEGPPPTLVDMTEMHNHALRLLSTYPDFRTNMFHGLFLGEPLPYLRFWMRRDRLFSAGQNNPNATAFLAQHLFSNRDDVNLWSYVFVCLHRYGRFYTNRGTLEFDILAFAAKISSISEIQRKRLCDRLYLNDPGQVNAHKISAILLKMCNEMQTQEKDFLFPHKIRSSINNEPAVITDRNISGIRNNASPFTANSLLEGFYVKGIISDTGQQFESAVKTLFKVLGFNVFSGYYFFEGQWYESDCLLVEDNQIYSFELKTKPLTRESRSGNMNKFLRDILQSFVAAINQSMRIHLALRKLKSLTIFKSRSTEARPVIELKFHSERTKFRSFCLTPAGMESLCQPVVSGNLIQIFMQWEVRLNQQNEKTQTETTQVQEEFRNLVAEMQKTSADPTDILYSLVANVSFISFDELYIIASISRHKQTFFDIFINTLHTQEGSFKLYTKLLQALRLYDHRRTAKIT